MRVQITKEAFAAMAAHKRSALTDWSEDEALGSIELSEDVRTRLIELAHPGESISDTIVRVCSFMAHGMN